MAGEVYFDFTLDFGNVSIPRRLRITQYGDLLPVLRAKLYNMGGVYSIPAGASVRVRWKKPSGTVVYNPVTVFSDNIITYPVDAQCLAVPGICSACFEIALDGKTLESPIFAVEVAKNPMQKEDIKDTPQLDALEQVVADAAEQAQAGFDDAVERAKAEASDIAADAAANASAAADRAEEAAKRAESFAPEGGMVISVNGKGGAVTLNAQDVGALPAPESPVVGQLLRIKSVQGGTITLETVPESGGFVEIDTNIPAEERADRTLYWLNLADLSTAEGGTQ